MLINVLRTLHKAQYCYHVYHRGLPSDVANHQARIRTAMYVLAACAGIYVLAISLSAVIFGVSSQQHQANSPYAYIVAAGVLIAMSVGIYSMIKKTLPDLSANFNPSQQRFFVGLYFRSVAYVLVYIFVCMALAVALHPLK